MFFRPHNFRVLLGALLFSFSLASCKKSFLEVTPPTSLPSEQALKTEADLLVATRGMYAGMRSSALYGRDVPLFGDLMADVTYVSPQNSNRFIAQYSYSPTNTTGTGIWTSAYTVALRANKIINASVPASANVNQYKGEAYATRALMYFELVRFFAKPYTDNANGPGVPIVLEDDPNLLPARASISEVYAKIISDLQQAASLMTKFTNSSTMHSWAAKGLLAKVYLTMGDYANARTTALDVINNSGFTVVTAANYAGYWRNAAPRTDKVETLFEVTSDIANNAGTDALAYIYSQAGYGDMMAAHDFYNSHAAGDVRTSFLVTKFRGGENAWTVEKYSNTNNAGDKDDVKILRMSDVYLIAAEASYHTGNETDARTYLNHVATRRVAAFPGYTSSGAALLEGILSERKKELAFEGDRLHTLNRLKLPIQRGADYPATARTIAYGDYRRVLAIPLEERQANPGIEQNEGYQ
jgi:starch-binding outer membrane protein, SusD/RagB family